MSTQAEPEVTGRRNWRLISFALVWAIFCLAADYLTGPGVQFGSLYAVPVVVTAWYADLAMALTVAFALPIAEFFLDQMWGSFNDAGEEMFRSFVRLVALVIIALLVHRFSRSRAAPAHTTPPTLDRRLELPSDGAVRCEVCSRVQDASGNWWTLDDRLLASLHDARGGRCPTCATLPASPSLTNTTR